MRLNEHGRRLRHLYLHTLHITHALKVHTCHFQHNVIRAYEGQKWTLNAQRRIIGGHSLAPLEAVAVVLKHFIVCEMC
jgi:hypothetical protein